MMASLREGRPWMTNATLCLLGMGLLLLTREYSWEYGPFGHYVIGASGCSGWSVWLYLAAIVVVMTQPVDRATFGIVVTFAVGFEAMTLLNDPFSSSDVYRYVWDGVVQHAHVNPYRYVPGDAALRYLRAPNQDVFDGINRRDYARTIYPPVAQAVYWLVTFFSPTVAMMKIAMVGFLCVAGAAIVALLKSMGRRREELLLFAWFPMLAWEIGGAGHVDAVVIAFVVLAFLFRQREQPVWTGLFLGLAVFTKFYPLVLLPCLWTRRGWRVDWKMPAMVAAVGVVGYSVYISAGKLVLGFLTGYAKEEGIDSGARFFLLDWLQRRHGLENVPVAGYEGFCVVVMGAIALWAWRFAMVEGFTQPAQSVHPTHDDETVMNGPPGNSSYPEHDDEAVMVGAPAPGERFVPHSSAMKLPMNGPPRFMQAAMAMGFAMMLLFSPHYPWYVVWLIPLFALVPNVPLLAYLLGFFYLFTTALADPGPKMFLLNEILYGGMAVVAVAQATVLRRWPLRRMFRV